MRSALLSLLLALELLGTSAAPIHIAPTQVAPTPRTWQTAVSAPNGGVLLFGGITPSPEASVLGDTWTLLQDGAMTWWHRDNREPAPEPRWGHVMVQDPIRSVVLYGGCALPPDSGPSVTDYVTSTWHYGTDGWLQIDTINNPGPRWGAAMAWCPTIGACVLYGGYDPAGVPLSDTWAYDGILWLRLDTPHHPYLSDEALGLAEHAMAPDADGNLLLFGGTDGDWLSGNTWLLADGDWQLAPTNVVPWPRRGAAMVWDDALQRVVLYGGETTSVMGDTYTWEATGWVRQSVDGALPPPRVRASLVYDIERGATLLLGGNGPDDAVDDTVWAFYGDSWEVVPLSDPPVYITSFPQMMKGWVPTTMAP